MRSPPCCELVTFNQHLTDIFVDVTFMYAFSVYLLHARPRALFLLFSRPNHPNANVSHARDVAIKWIA